MSTDLTLLTKNYATILYQTIPARNGKPEQKIPVGLEFKDGLTLEDYEEAGRLIINYHYLSTAFVLLGLGDWYNSLESEHGDKKQQVEDTYGEGWYHQFRKFASIAAKFPAGVRRPDARRWMYEECAALPPQNRMDAYHRCCNREIHRTQVREMVKLTRPAKPKQITAKLDKDVQCSAGGTFTEVSSSQEEGTPAYKPTTQVVTSPAWNGGLAKDAEDDGLPIPANGKVEQEREQFETTDTAPTWVEGQAGLPLTWAERQAGELEALRLDAAMYQKVKPYLERIEACIEEDILKWLSDTAATLEEEKAWAEQNT